MIDFQSKDFNGHQLATVFRDGGDKKVVIFCHGYRGTSVGPNRFFVRTVNKLVEKGISTFQFDQFGSGNSEGDFFNSSFNDWLETTKMIAESYLELVYKVALFGQSMGGAAVIGVGSELPELAAIVAWVPDPNVEAFEPPVEGFVEESGQRVQASFWQEAHNSHIASKLSSVKVPTFIVQCTADEYIDQQNRDAISMNAQPHHKVENFENYSHSGWDYDQAEDIINKGIEFIASSFGQ